MDIKIDSNFKNVIDELKKLPRNIQDKVLRPVLNDAARSGRTEAARSISSEFNVKSSEVRKATSSKVTKINNQFVGVITSKSDKRLQNLVHFVKNRSQLTKPKVLKSGKRRQSPLVIVEVRRNHRKVMNKLTFLANSNKTIFQREKGNWVRNRKTGKMYEKIRAKSSISITGMFKARRISKRIIENVESVLLKRFEYHSGRVLEKWK